MGFPASSFETHVGDGAPNSSELSQQISSLLCTREAINGRHQQRKTAAGNSGDSLLPSSAGNSGDSLLPPSAGNSRDSMLPPSAGNSGDSWLPSLHLLDSGPPRPENQRSVTDAQTTSRGRLVSDAQHKLSASEYQQFQENMLAFERRAKEKGLPSDAVAKVYDQVSKLLEKPGKVEHPERIAQSIMQYAANPDRIDQGNHPTCAIDALEKETFAHNPAAAASMIVSVALSGTWRSSDGMLIDVGKFPDNLTPGEEESRWPTNDGERSMASQLFQATALNDIGLHLNPPRYYDEGKPYSGIVGTLLSFAMPSLTSEHWRNADGSDRGMFTGTQLDWLNDETKRLLGTASVLVTDIKGDGVQVTSEEQLRQKIQDAAKNNQLPLEVGLNAYDPAISSGPNHYPYFVNWLIARIQNPRGTEDHALTINQYDPATDTVMVHNNWGSKNDHRVPISDLYRAVSGN